MEEGVRHASQLGALVLGAEVLRSRRVGEAPEAGMPARPAFDGVVVVHVLLRECVDGHLARPVQPGGRQGLLLASLLGCPDPPQRRAQLAVTACLPAPGRPPWRRRGGRRLPRERHGRGRGRRLPLQRRASRRAGGGPWARPGIGEAAGAASGGDGPAEAVLLSRPVEEDGGERSFGESI